MAAILILVPEIFNFASYTAQGWQMATDTSPTIPHAFGTLDATERGCNSADQHLGAKFPLQQYIHSHGQLRPGTVWKTSGINKVKSGEQCSGPFASSKVEAEAMISRNIL